MRQYLLGTLSSDQRTAVEQRYFEDPAYLERLEAAETLLVDEYAAGRLSREEILSSNRIT